MPKTPSLDITYVKHFADYCLWLEKQARKASYHNHPAWFDDHKLKPLRDGIVFYSGGWGWRLRKGWRQTFVKRFGIKAVYPGNFVEATEWKDGEP